MPSPLIAALHKQANNKQQIKSLATTDGGDTLYHYVLESIGGKDQRQIADEILASGKLRPGNEIPGTKEKYKNRPPGRGPEPGMIYMSPHKLDIPGAYRFDVPVSSLPGDSMVQLHGKKFPMARLKELLSGFPPGQAQRVFDRAKERKFKALLQVVHKGAIPLNMASLHKQANNNQPLLTPEQEQEAISRYYPVTGADTSHAYDEHVKKVRDIASRLAGQRKLPIAHRHMLDTAALLHDITRNTDTTDTHHETGAVEASKLLQEWKLPADKVQAIAAMIRQHRASVPVGPDIPEYAKILRDADRLSSAGGALARSYKYQLGHGATNEDAALMSAVAHMMHKYHPTTGYGANALHFPESKDIYRAEYDDVVKAYEADVDKGNMPGPALRALAGIGKQAAETIPIQCGQEKLKLRMVDGTAVRNKHFTDFTMAGHGHVYSFIPKDEIWLEANLSAEDASHALNHELRERELMRTHGLKYDQAHQLVTNMERHERGGQADDKHAYTNNAK